MRDIAYHAVKCFDFKYLQSDARNVEFLILSTISRRASLCRE